MNTRIHRLLDKPLLLLGTAVLGAGLLILIRSLDSCALRLEAEPVAVRAQPVGLDRRRLDDLADDGQAQTRVGAEGRAARTRGVEALEHRLEVFGRNAGPVVLDRHQQATALGTGLHEHPAIGPFAGIVEQVAQHFVQVL